MDIVIRAAVAYVFIIFILRVMGRRELSSLGPSDLVLVVVLGDLVQNGVTQADQSVTGMIIAISTFALLTVGMSVLTFKSRRAQTLIEGQPLILVQDGMPVEKNLRAGTYSRRRRRGRGARPGHREDRRHQVVPARDERQHELRQEAVRRIASRTWFRKSSWMRVSSVSSGWNAATRMRPCRASTG